MLDATKDFLRNHGYHYKKTYIRPLFTPNNVYVFRFGKNGGDLNNRLIIRYGHGWTGRQRIKEIDLRLHKQKHPRIFKSERGLLKYLVGHLQRRDDGRNSKEITENNKDASV